MSRRFSYWWLKDEIRLTCLAKKSRRFHDFLVDSSNPFIGPVSPSNTRGRYIILFWIWRLWLTCNITLNMLFFCHFSPSACIDDFIQGTLFTEVLNGIGIFHKICECDSWVSFYANYNTIQKTLPRLSDWFYFNLVAMGLQLASAFVCLSIWKFLLPPRLLNRSSTCWGWSSWLPAEKIQITIIQTRKPFSRRTTARLPTDVTQKRGRSYPMMQWRGRRGSVLSINAIRGSPYPVKQRNQRSPVP